MAQLKGLIHHIGETQKVNDNFSKREFILITEHDTQIGMKITARRKVSTRQMPQFNI